MNNYPVNGSVSVSHDGEKMIWFGGRWILWSKSFHLAFCGPGTGRIAVFQTAVGSHPLPPNWVHGYA